MRDRLDLFVARILVLFLELACIRLFPAHVLFLTFFTNVMLLAAFLGTSVGCLAAGRRRNYLAWTPLLLLLALEVSYLIEVQRQKTGGVVKLGNVLSSQNVLVIGAGSGNDVSRALQWGATHVDAVEIDPVIYRLGRRDHPDQPYADPRVTVHLDDGRNHLRSTTEQYDLIVYALVDSLVLHSGYSNIRLESYLFTSEAFADIRTRLRPGGLFVMDTTSARGGSSITCTRCSNRISGPGTRSCSTCRAARRSSRTMCPGLLAHMFFLGAGFMLIETKAVVQMALLFGGTWMVNSIVFCAVLVMILAANLFVSGVRPRSLAPFYAGLGLSLTASALIPLDAFLGLPRALQIAGSCALAFTPVFFAGVVFAMSFSRAADAGRAFGANVAGAMAGGFSEYSSMLFGFQYVILVALGFYVCAAISRWQWRDEPSDGVLWQGQKKADTSAVMIGPFSPPV